MKKYSYAILPALAAAAMVISAPWFYKAYVHPFPAADTIREVRGSAIEDSLALSLGLRRLAADLWFIRLMQYYGSSELDGQEPHAAHEEGPAHGEPGHRCHAGEHFGEGKYPDFLPIARHILALDPYYTNACLYAAGSLAFNMKRAAEAEAFLKEALKFNPKEWKYATLLAAMGYRTDRDPVRIAEVITPLIREPDCPVMLRQLAAFLNKKAGNYSAAYEIYGVIMQTTKDRFYIDNAVKERAFLEKAGKVRL